MPSAERTKQQAQKKRDSQRRSQSISFFFLPIHLYFNLSLASNEYPVPPKGRPRKGFFKDINYSLHIQPYLLVCVFAFFLFPLFF